VGTNSFGTYVSASVSFSSLKCITVGKNDNLPGSGADIRRCETSEDVSSDSRCGSKHTVCQNSLAHATSSDELAENSSLSSHVFTSEKSEAISLKEVKHS